MNMSIERKWHTISMDKRFKKSKYDNWRGAKGSIQWKSNEG